MKKLFAVILILSLSGCLFAFGPGNDRDDNPRKGKDFKQGQMKSQKDNLIKELGLSKDQLRALDKFRDENVKQNMGIHKESSELHIALRKELTKSNLNEGDVKETESKILDLQKKILDNQVKSLKEMRRVLTPEQLKKLNELSEQLEDKMLEMRVERGLGGPDMGPGMMMR